MTSTTLSPADADAKISIAHMLGTDLLDGLVLDRNPDLASDIIALAHKHLHIGDAR